MRILVFQTAFLGDLILTIPLICGIKKFFNEAEIVVLVRGGLGEIIRNMDEVESVIEYDKTGEDKGIFRMIDIIKILRRGKFDIVFSPHRSLRTSIILYLSRIPLRIGFKESALSFIYSITVSRDNQLHEIERNLLLLKSVVPDFRYEYLPKIRINNKVHEGIIQKLSNYGILNHNNIITVAPGSHWGTKRWLPERYSEVISRLIEDGYNIILIGSKEDRTIAERIESLCNNRVVNLCGETTVLESVAVIELSRVLLSNDSAAVHIASFTGTPVVVIYGPTLPSFGFTPYGVDSAIIEYNGLRCRPCSSHGPMECPEGHFKCMRMISTDEVYSTVRKLTAKYAEKV